MTYAMPLSLPCTDCGADAVYARGWEPVCRDCFLDVYATDGGEIVDTTYTETVHSQLLPDYNIRRMAT